MSKQATSNGEYTPGMDDDDVEHPAVTGTGTPGLVAEGLDDEPVQRR